MSSSLAQELYDFFNNPNIFLDGSGTGALINVLTAVDCKGKQVVLPAMTCPNVAIAVYAAGATPVYVDIDLTTGNMDTQLIRKRINDQTCAIIAVHSFGYPLDINSIKKEHKDIIIIEDACQAYGGFVKSQPLGTFGDIGIISFGYAKSINAGKGSAIIINNPSYLGKISKRFTPKDPSSPISDRIKYLLAMKLMFKGHNRLLRFLATNMGLYTFSLPEKLDPEIQNRFHSFRGRISNAKKEIFDAVKLLNHPKITQLSYKGNDWLPWRYTFRVKDASFRKAFIRSARQNGLKVSSLYQPVIKHFDKNPDLSRLYPAAERWSREAVNLVYDYSRESTRALSENIKKTLSAL